MEFAYKNVESLIIWFKKGKNHLRSCSCDDCIAYRFGKKRNGVLKEALAMIKATMENNKRCIFCGVNKDVFCVKGNDICLCTACIEDVVIFRDWLNGKSIKEVL